MASKASLSDVAPIEPVDIALTVANRLRDMLAQGRFQPGEQITEPSIAAAFHVGRGPVREALKRLTEQGLLVSERNRGVFVPVLSTEDVEAAARGAHELAALETPLLVRSAVAGIEDDPRVLATDVVSMDVEAETARADDGHPASRRARPPALSVALGGQGEEGEGENREV